LQKGARQRTAAIRLKPAPQLRFLVRDGAGQPIEAARIYWNATRPGKKKRADPTALPLVLGKTDAKGELVQSGVPEGATGFYCRHPAFALGQVHEAGPDHTVRFTLGPAGRLRGMLAEDGRAPREPCTVLAEPSGETRRKFLGVLLPAFTQTLPDGSFSFANLQPGIWRVRAMSPIGEATSPAELIRMARQSDGRGPPVKVEIVPAAEAFVQLERHTVVSAGAGSVVGSLRIDGKPPSGVRVMTWGARQATSVREDGTFALTGLADGDHWIGVEQGGSGLLPCRLWEGRVRIENGSQAALHLDLRVGDLTVEVVDGAREPVSGMPIELLGDPSDSGTNRGVVRVVVATDPAGKAVFRGLPFGGYRARSALHRPDGGAVLGTSRLEHRSAGEVLRLTAVTPARVEARLRFDESALTGAAEHEYARRFRPRYLVFEGDGRFVWGAVQERAGESWFVSSPGSPGEYRLSGRGPLRWTSSPLRLGGDAGVPQVVELRPDEQQVRAAVAKQRAEAQNKAP
ncbi:MAG: hypothetical protein KDC87_18970, partial [Planctomycetes bacterium]|nr:hypothetical protein [Planctomycetota bacterium]